MQSFHEPQARMKKVAETTEFVVELSLKQAMWTLTCISRSSTKESCATCRCPNRSSIEVHANTFLFGKAPYIQELQSRLKQPLRLRAACVVPKFHLKEGFDRIG